MARLKCRPASDRPSAEYVRIEEGRRDALDRAIDRYGIRWTIVAADTPLAELLDNRQGWRRLYADRYAVVHVRDDVVAAVCR